MKTRTWLVLVLVLFLAGCAGGPYSSYSRESYDQPAGGEPVPWYINDGIPPLPVPAGAG